MWKLQPLRSCDPSSLPNSKVIMSLFFSLRILPGYLIFFLGIREKSSLLCTEMNVMLCCLYCSGGPDLSADDSEEAEKVGNNKFYFMVHTAVI